MHAAVACEGHNIMINIIMFYADIFVDLVKHSVLSPLLVRYCAVIIVIIIITLCLTSVCMCWCGRTYVECLQY